MEVMMCATARLDLQWRHEKGQIAHGRLDERFRSVDRWRQWWPLRETCG